jgi:hypothetical protein
MPKGRFALLLQERQWPNAYIILTHAVAHVSGFDEFVAACEAAQTSVTRSFPGPSRRPCEVAASALTTAHALAGERARNTGRLEARASRDAHAPETSGSEGARSTLLLGCSSNGLAGVVHRFERDLGDQAAVLDHGLEALADKTALGRREILH